MWSVLFVHLSGMAETSTLEYGIAIPIVSIDFCQCIPLSMAFMLAEGQQKAKAVGFIFPSHFLTGQKVGCVAAVCIKDLICL